MQMTDDKKVNVLVALVLCAKVELHGFVLNVMVGFA
jgi:hypothetical protein